MAKLIKDLSEVREVSSHVRRATILEIKTLCKERRKRKEKRKRKDLVREREKILHRLILNTL